MVSTCRIFTGLLWKCSILRRRNYILTILDIVAPLFLFYWLHFLLKGSDVKTKNLISKEENILGHNLDGHIAYYPSNDDTDNIMLSVIANEKYVKIEGIKSFTELESWLDNKTDKYLTKSYLSPDSFGIVFKNINATGRTIEYEIRPCNGHIKTVDKDDSRYDLQESPYENTLLLLAIQARLNMQFLNMTGLDIWKGDMVFEPLKLGGGDPYHGFDGVFIMFVIAYIFLVISITRDVIEEKSSGIKEYMRILGLSPFMIWIQWLIYTLLVHLPVTVGITYMLCILSPPVVPGNPFIIWLLLLLFTITCTLILLIISCLFDRPTLGTTVSFLCWIFINILAMIYLLKPKDFGTFVQILICFLPLNNLIWALATITSFQVSGATWKMTHIFVLGSSGSQISVGMSLLISIVVIFLLTLLLVWLDGIMPGKYGVAKNITFMCDSYCGLKSSTSENPTAQQAPLPKRYEQPPKGAKVGIGIRNLKKCYGTRNKVTAVDSVDLDIYEGEIMGLLGHNGAGKTTTMSMLTGMTQPTSGVIVFGGKDISKDKSYRDSLGLCPQHNMYFSKLTVMENLVFFGLLRGMTFGESKKRGIELLDLLKITNRSKYKVKNLSGGMKRRLCLAISLVGRPKYLILDEPTSGLDPENRRNVWDIILGLRGERTILITTHFMEEADVLSNRIAIMDKGNVVCCGTTMFLKRLYGIGYQLNILKDVSAPQDDILTLVKGNVSSSQTVSATPTQLSINLPEDNVKMFPALFRALERNKSSLKINSIAVNFTTMEDVFLNVAHKFTKDDAVVETTSKTEIKLPKSTENIQNLQSWDLFFQRWKALQLKYVLFRFAKPIGIIITIIMTCIIFWLLVVNTLVEKVELVPQPPLAISLDLYPNCYSILIHDNESKGLADTVREIIVKHKSEVDILSPDTDIDENLNRLSNSDFPKFSRLTLFINITKNKFLIQHKKLYHITPVIINLMTNAVLKHSLPNDTGKLDVIVHPYVPKGTKCGDSSWTVPYVWTIILPCVFSFILATFTSPVTGERVSGFKQQQYLTGVSPLLYWFSYFIYDYCLYLFISMLYLSIFVLIGGKEVIVSGWFYVLGLIFILLGISGILFVYLFTFLINNINMSYNLFPLLCMVFTFFPLSLLIEIKSFSLFMFVICILCINPLFSFMSCIYYLSPIMVSSFQCNACNYGCNDSSKPLFKMITEKNRDGSLPYIIFLALSWVLYIITILIIDCKLYRKVILLVIHKKANRSTTEDTDAKAEMDRVKMLKDTNDSVLPLRAEWLSKKYLFGPRAVKHVSFALLPGECFGLLGVNGSGKTTTFKMLVGEIFPDCGDAVIRGTSVIKGIRKYQSQVGYCPQFDTFPECLTGEQVLMIFAQLKGIPKKDSKKEANKWLDMLGITEHAKKKGGTYSGGTKRKLSTAMAFIGNPVVVFLDEPTTGVDPEARRKLWIVMKARQEEGQAILLTSHSMEECEALCNRLTIMRDGTMMCLGSPEYLKNKFSLGYTFLVKLKDPTDDKLKSFKEDLNKKLPNSVIKDEHQTLINYNITDPEQLLSQLFEILLSLKEKHKIVEDFSISNTTLEQLFMSFVQKSESV